MKIIFILSDPTQNIVGGYKVAYLYANALANCGYDVEIIYRCYQQYDNYFKQLLNYPYRFVVGHSAIGWFDLASSVKKRVVRKLKLNISEAIIVATTCKTALEIQDVGLNKDNRILYLIQDYETWIETESRIQESYKLGFENIVVSQWLERLVNQYAISPSIYIPNGIDLNCFLYSLEYSSRPKHSISMLYHTQERKGSKEGLQAIYKLKEHIPDLVVDLFGSPEPPRDLPNWITYTHNASQNEVAQILNRNRVYLMPSKKEGFGLPGLEAMACGCVLISTPCQGVFEYAQNGYNSYIINDYSSESMCLAINDCFNSDSKAMEICKNGLITAQRFSMNSSIDKIIALVNRCN